MADSNPQYTADREATPPRRNLLVAAGALVVGILVSIVPLIPGLVVLTDPLRKKRTRQGKMVRVTTLDAVPSDGVPHRFPVVATRRDAWNKYPPEPIGGVYLLRSATDGAVTAFSVICPHLGCACDYKPGAHEFQCPCHTSGFALNGAVKYGPSPRPMDTLEVEIRDGVDVWVKYERFKVGKSEKIPV